MFRLVGWVSRGLLISNLLRSDTAAVRDRGDQPQLFVGPPTSVAAPVIARVNPTLGIAVIGGLMVLYLLPRAAGT